MNERIREIAEQAGLEFDDDLALEPEPIYYITQKELEKFAQLIVGECIDINRHELSFNAFEQLMNRYNDHFGVEP